MQTGWHPPQAAKSPLMEGGHGKAVTGGVMERTHRPQRRVFPQIETIAAASHSLGMAPAISPYRRTISP
jgi:hypothetical protein